MHAFPDHFLWGTSTSAHQVEGGNINDWSLWEKETAGEKAYRATLRNFPSHIPTLFPLPTEEINYVSGIATDHYHRFQEDTELMKTLSVNAYRFSIEWSRVQPQEGMFSESALEYYEKLIDELTRNGITPFVTLWHWPIPIWMKDKGGWENKDSITHFLRYVEKIITRLGHKVTFWITLNEPEIYAGNSYLAGIWPPQKTNVFSYIRVLNHLIAAHKTSYKLIKHHYPKSQIGIAKNNIYFEASTNTFANKFVTRIIDWYWNKSLLNSIRENQDFIGLNFYFHKRLHYGFEQNKNEKTSDLGWELYPRGIYHVLKDLKVYKKPIYITENGLADAKDIHRSWFIRETLKNVFLAIQDGVDVRGYFHWSLLDNFEWDKGFWPRFGLVEIDYHTLKRNPRQSFYDYAKICKENGFS